MKICKVSLRNLYKIIFINQKIFLFAENDMTNNKRFAKTYLKNDNWEYIRLGVIGGHKSEMSQEYINRFDEWMAEKEKLNQGFTFKEGKM